EDNMTFYKTPKLDEDAAPVPEGDYVADSNAPMYYLAMDTRGELAFEENTFGYGGVPSHIVVALTERVPKNRIPKLMQQLSNLNPLRNCNTAHYGFGI